MKILHVSDNFNATTGHFVNIAPKKLKERGYNVEVYTSTKSFNRIKHGDTSYPVPIKRFRGKIIFNRNIFPGLITGLLFKNLEIVHGYVLAHFSTLVLGYLRRIKKFKFVVEADFNISEPKPSLLKSVYVYFYRKVPARSADIITTFTTEQKNELSRRWKLDKKKIKVLPIGIEYNKFQKVDKKFKKKLGLESKFVLLNISRLVPQKNIEVILQALKDLPNAYFVHIGQITDKEYKKKLDKIAGNRVKFVGYVDSKDLPAYYQVGDVYIQPSHKESFGISLVEAMASGLPALTVKEGVAVDIVNNKNGFFIQNSKDIVKYVKKLQNKKLIKKMSEESRKSAKNYDWEKIIDKLEGIYRGSI